MQENPSCSSPLPFELRLRKEPGDFEKPIGSLLEVWIRDHMVYKVCFIGLRYSAALTRQLIRYGFSHLSM